MDEYIAFVSPTTGTVEVFQPGTAFFINLADIPAVAMWGGDVGGMSRPALVDEDALTIVQQASMKYGAAYRIDDIDQVVLHH